MRNIPNLEHTDLCVRYFTKLLMTSLVIRVLDELNNDVFTGLNLEHLEDKAEERGGFYVSSKHSSHMV